MFKIKFLDTGEELEVTRAEQLANTKVRVTPWHSVVIQKAAFKLGYGWGPGGHRVHNEKAPYLYFYENALGFGESSGYFENHAHREFEFLPSQPQQIQRGETGQRGEITPEALEAEGWEIRTKTWCLKGIFEVFFNNDGADVWAGELECEGVKTMSDLRTLDRLVNGVAIPSTTNN